MSSNDSTPLRYIVQKHKEQWDINRGKMLFQDGMWRGSIDMVTVIHNAPSLMKDLRSELLIHLMVKGMIQEYVRFCRKQVDRHYAVQW